MSFNGDSAEAMTPVKCLQSSRPNASANTKSENLNPNVTSSGSKVLRPPAIKSAAKSATRSTKTISSASPRNKLRQRKFVVAKKSSKASSSNAATCKCNPSGKSKNCLCLAYASLRASQEDFVKNRREFHDHCELEKLDRTENEIEEDDIESPKIENRSEGELGENDRLERNETTCSSFKRRREKVMEEARNSVPEPGCGRVMHLVRAFEKLLSIPKSTQSTKSNENDSENRTRWALPGLQQPRVSETQVSSSSICPSDFLLTSENLGLDSRVSSSFNRRSLSRRNSAGGRRSRRNSTESTRSFGGIHRTRKPYKITSQKPFKLRTEQRGRSKEEEFIKKVHQMMTEEEKQRIPIAQGLPWTTDEPECLVKPPVKETTKPVELILHSDVRAMERAEFDHQVAEKMSLLEQYRLETERERRLAEEEEIRRLRKELVPRAQPMPYFDRPFVPRRSEKLPTIPKEPRFQIPQHKKIKCCMSCNDLNTHQQ